jgi:hypothetical protein
MAVAGTLHLQRTTVQQQDKSVEEQGGEAEQPAKVQTQI